MVERSQNGEKAILVQINFGHHDDEVMLEEFSELALSSGAILVYTITGSRHSPDPKYFVGQGKALEIQQAVQTYQADLVLINHELSPAQERNLETLLSCRVLGRTGLILDIFAQHARTFEGKLQVELAQLQHLATRLVRGWGHLKSQQGGIGFRGPGETQLETDRRLIRVRIKNIKKRLERVRKQRHQIRQARLKIPVPTLSIIGYTNAGKSTLFNALTQSSVYVADQLFATLDPTLRYIQLPHFGKAMLADTVGFIRNLPHDLVDAFHATLEETRDASLLLHVVGANQETRHEQVEIVNKVLKQIEAENIPQLIIFNKIDLLKDISPRVDQDEKDKPARIWISAQKNQGMDLLMQAIAQCLTAREVHCGIRLTHAEGAMRSKLYELKAVLYEDHAENGDYLIELRLPQDKFLRLLASSRNSTR